MTILNYLNSRKYIFFLILLCSAIHIAVLWIYGYEIEPIGYASVIYLILIFFLGSLDYIRQRKKYKLLESYNIDTDKGLQELIPTTEPITKEYQNIISKLQNRQMHTATTQLQKEKENSDFYTMWVHQIKTPIAALQILMQTAPENLSGMKGELFKIEQYVNTILNYLRMEDMNQDLLLKRYSLDVLVKQAVKKYTPLFIQSKLSLKLEDLSAAVLTDEKWLVFVLEQLFSNAIKYTKSGGIRVFARVSQKENTKITRLSIEDTGIGICEEDLPRIFERAFTGYNGRRDKKASGLGLYLCKTILKKLGHEISIISAPQNGTCVTITFYESIPLGGNLAKM